MIGNKELSKNEGEHAMEIGSWIICVIKSRYSSTVNNPGPSILCTGVTYLQRIGLRLVHSAISMAVAGRNNRDSP
ncbi:hypothetical protein DCAR_0205267 [Daucus carota subsp. sativus]|uniref:Uncharacterized protein n=1 Tax=Daucus carota subsp. sativus TaxID=79200 RepID=A0A175YCG2_DAUCS|nr:hypothetical protein DCAR_0205267 [Daucus carota subsp. sativus]